MICTSCGQMVDAGAQFCSGCGRPVARYAAPATTERLIRPREGRMIAGVCAAFALRYGWDVALVRLVLVLAAIFGAGTPFLAYLIAWIVIPNGQYSLPAQTSVPFPAQAVTQSQVPADPQTGTGPGSMAM